MKTKSFLILFFAFSALWLAICALLTMPQVQLLIIAFVENYVIERPVNHPDMRISNMSNAAMLGFAFYALVVFLMLIENLFIKPKPLPFLTGGGGKSPSKERLDFIFFALITLLAIAIRLTNFSYVTVEYLNQSAWTKELRDKGIFTGLKNFTGNYNAVYLYFISILSVIPLRFELYLMKAVFCAFDFIQAFYAMKIVKKLTADKKSSIIVYIAVLFAPTMVINASLMAQCDAIYAAFVLISLYFLLCEKPQTAMLHFGIALSIKLQSVFPLPFILLFFVNRKISLKNLLFAPVGFIAVSIPAWLAGWPVVKTLVNYLDGTDTAGALTHNAPTIFAWAPFPAMFPVAFITAGLFCLGFLVINKPEKFSNGTILLLFLFSSFVIPFFLPRMHERYFYIGELAVLLYAVVNPKRFWIVFSVIIPAVQTYIGFLYGANIFSLQILSFVYLFAVVIITKWLIESLICADARRETPAADAAHRFLAR